MCFRALSPIRGVLVIPCWLNNAHDCVTAAKTPAKQRAIKISSTVDHVCTEAYQNGLQTASLDKLIDIITLPNHVDQSSVGNLIKNLYPASKVPDTIVVKVVGSLGHGRVKPSYSTQVALLRWLVMVYDVLESHMILSRLYSTLFNLLDTIAIRYTRCSAVKVFADALLFLTSIMSLIISHYSAQTCQSVPNSMVVSRCRLQCGSTKAHRLQDGVDPTSW